MLYARRAGINGRQHQRRQRRRRLSPSAAAASAMALSEITEKVTAEVIVSSDDYIGDSQLHRR
jgi:hypothetical protein